MPTDPLYRAFRILNRYFMVPAFRLGLGSLIGNPFSGYIMVLKTVGRKSGLVRPTPVNYAILDGCVYCLAGLGKDADWYRNLCVQPRVELVLPGGACSGTAETVEDPAERLRAARQVLKASGFAGLAAGYDAFRMSDAELAAKLTAIKMVRIRLTGPAAGPADYGGWLWIALSAVGAVLLGLLLRPKK